MSASSWRKALPAAFDGELRSCLQERQSLTKRIMSHCSAALPFSLRVVTQATQPPFYDECKLLHLKPGSKARVREVLLQRNGMPLVFTHSVVSLAALRGAWHCIDGIGGQALGSVLFTDPAISIGALHFCRLDARHRLYQRAVRWCDQAPPYLWARRAVHHRAGCPLLVCEVFLSKI